MRIFRQVDQDIPTWPEISDVFIGVDGTYEYGYFLKAGRRGECWQDARPETLEMLALLELVTEVSHAD